MNKLIRTISIFLLCAILIINFTGCSKKRSKNTNPVATDISKTSEDSSAKFSLWDKDAKIRAAIENKEYQKAERIAKARAAKNPRDSKSYFFLGKIYLAQDMLSKSKSALENALDLDPDNRTYKREISKCLSAMADLAIDKDMPMEAVIFLKKVIKNRYKTNITKQKLAQAYIQIGKKLVANNNIDEAEILFNQALNVLPDAPEIRVALAKLLIKSDRLMEANRLLTSLLETNPKYEEGIILFAQLLYKMGEIDEAKNIIGKALASSPNNTEAIALLEKLHGGTNAQPTLISSHVLTISLTTDEAKEQLSALEKTDNYHEAVTLLRNFLSSEPNEDWAKLKLVSTYLKLGNNSEALTVINEYLAKKPDDSEAQFLKSMCLKQTNKLLEASALLENLVSSNPDRLDILNVYGEVYAKSGKFDKALEIWNKILLIDSNFAETLFNIAQLNTEMGKYKVAQEYFEKAIHKEPFNSKFIYFAGINLMHSGLKSEAISLWETGRSYLNSENQYGRRILKALGEESNNSNSGLQVVPPTLATENSEINNPDMLGSISNSEIGETPENSDYTTALEYARGGFFTEAISGFKAVLAQEPNHFNALMNLGKVYTASNNHENACANYLKAVKLEPKNIFALRGLANEYSELGLHKLASEVTKQVKLRAPDQLQGFPRYKVASEFIRNNPRAFAPLVSAFISAGLKQEALAVVKTGLKELPEEASLHMLQGDVLRDLGDFNSALASYKVALNKDQQSPAPFLRIGDLYATSSQISEAIAEYKKALKASFIDADTMFEIVNRFEGLGQKREANRILGRLKAMNLNQAQILKLEQHLGTKIETTPQGDN